MVVLRVGSKGNEVLQLQTLLFEKGYNIKKDGIFGNNTLEIVKIFQKSKNLSSDGIVGEKTWLALQPQPSPEKSAVLLPPATKIENDIVKNALSYNLQKEIPPNKGFTDKSFEQKLKNVGWSSGLMWCMAFCKLCWSEAHPSYKLISKYLTLGSLDTWNKCISSVELITSNEPRPGSIAIWKNTASSGSGHGGIVTSFLKPDNTFETIEGNTAINGGEGVGKRIRTMGTQGTLKLLGFIYPELKNKEQ